MLTALSVFCPQKLHDCKLTTFESIHEVTGCRQPCLHAIIQPINPFRQYSQTFYSETSLGAYAALCLFKRRNIQDRPTFIRANTYIRAVYNTRNFKFRQQFIVQSNVKCVIFVTKIISDFALRLCSCHSSLFMTAKILQHPRRLMTLIETLFSPSRQCYLRS